MTAAFNTDDAKAALDVANDEQGFVSKSLFGPTPEMRGLQQRIASDEVVAYQAETISGIKSGKFNSMTAEEFQQKMTNDLSTKLKKYENDPEIQKALVDNHSKVAARVAPHQMLGHEIFKQGVAADQYDKRIADGATALEAGLGDPNLAEDFASSFERKPPQTLEAWQNSSTKAILGVLANGQTHAFDVLEQNPDMVLNKLTQEQRDAVETGHGNYIMQQTEEGYALQKSINQAVASGDKETLDKLVPAYNDYFPENPMNLNGVKGEADKVLAENARLGQEAHKNLTLAQQGLATTTEQFDAYIMDEAGKYRTKALVEQLANGDITQDVYDEAIATGAGLKDVTQWANDRPEELAAAIELNRGIPSKLLKATFSQNVSKLNSPGDLNKDIPEEAARMKSMDQSIVMFDTISKVSPEFIRNSLTEEQAKQMDAFSAERQNGGDINFTRNAVRENIGNDYDYNDWKGSAEYESVLEEAEDVFNDNVTGYFEFSKWDDLGVQADFEKHLKKQYESRGAQYAGPHAVKAMTRDMVEVQGVKHFGLGATDKELKKLNNKSGSLDGYMENVQDNPTMMQGFEDAGFDTEMWGDQFDENVSIQRVGTQIQITQIDNGNGYPVTRSIPMPTTDAEYHVTDNQGALEIIQRAYPSDYARPSGEKLAEKALIH
jgi:hypothetical protein